MAEQGMTSDLMKFMKEESGNVAMDGNYSIQVLQCKFYIILRGTQDYAFDYGINRCNR